MRVLKLESILIIGLVVLLIGGAIAAFTTNAPANKQKEFKNKCAAHDGLVYHTREGTLCMKRDSVIIIE